MKKLLLLMLVMKGCDTGGKVDERIAPASHNVENVGTVSNSTPEPTPPAQCQWIMNDRQGKYGAKGDELYVRISDGKVLGEIWPRTVPYPMFINGAFYADFATIAAAKAKAVSVTGCVEKKADPGKNQTP